MDPATFFAASRVVIVAGKGGVGKTTVTAALARAGIYRYAIERPLAGRRATQTTHAWQRMDGARTRVRTIVATEPIPTPPTVAQIRRTNAEGYADSLEGRTLIEAGLVTRRDLVNANIAAQAATDGLSVIAPPDTR